MRSTLTSLRNDALLDEFEDLFCGPRQNGGSARRVHIFKPDPTLVIKIEDREYASFQNILEWSVWYENQWNPEVTRWLAPCVRISRNGRVLLQKRTSPIRLPELPAQVPVWASDLQHGNWGILDGQPVMHDYGFTQLLRASDHSTVDVTWDKEGYGETAKDTTEVAEKDLQESKQRVGSNESRKPVGGARSR